VSHAAADEPRALLALYDLALPEVYGYLRHRCEDRLVAEDLTAETFVAAARSVRSGAGVAPSVPWLIGVARHKLIDHWRAKARDERTLAALEEADALSDPWEARLEVLWATEVLAGLTFSHRAALTLHYLDDLSVKEVAVLLDRTEGATEQLLARARSAFRRAYEAGERAD
jgi:RNA polymerase sigma-70 factor (ECF subfamily)